MFGKTFPNLNLATIYTYTEIGSSMILFITSLCALIYTLASKTRLVTITNVFIFVLITLSWGFMAALSIFDRGSRSQYPTSREFRIAANILYAFQFYPQWTSLLLFALSY